MGERAPEYGVPVPGHAAGRVAATRVSSVWALTLPVWLNSCMIECAMCVMGYPAAFAGTWSVERGGGGVDVRQAAMDVRCLCERAGLEGVCVCGLQLRMSTLCRRRLRVGACAPPSAVATPPALSGSSAKAPEACRLGAR